MLDSIQLLLFQILLKLPRENKEERHINGLLMGQALFRYRKLRMKDWKEEQRLFYISKKIKENLLKKQKYNKLYKNTRISSISPSPSMEKLSTSSNPSGHAPKIKSVMKNTKDSTNSSPAEERTININYNWAQMFLLILKQSFISPKLIVNVMVCLKRKDRSASIHEEYLSKKIVNKFYFLISFVLWRVLSIAKIFHSISQEKHSKIVHWWLNLETSLQNV